MIKRDEFRLSVDQFIKNEQLETKDIWSYSSFFITHASKDVQRRKFLFFLAFMSVFLVVVSTLVINQFITKGSLLFLKMSESNHGEIDAVITPSADIIATTIDGMKYDTPALMNFTAFTHYYETNDPARLERMLMSPRKVFTGVKVIREDQSGLYNETSPIQAERWRKGFIESTQLPQRTDVYHVKFNQGNDDGTIVLFKTDREKEIQIGREYEFDPMDIGECRVVKDDESAGGGAKEG